MSELPKCILLRGDPVYAEGIASASMTPGMLAVVMGSIATVGAFPACRPATAGETSRTFVRENEIMGYGISDPYLQDDNVLLMANRPGDQVYALLATGASVTAGDQLSAGAAGTLTGGTAGAVTGDDPVEAVTLPSAVIARALETVDNSGGSSPVRIKVEVL